MSEYWHHFDPSPGQACLLILAGCALLIGIGVIIDKMQDNGGPAGSTR